MEARSLAASGHEGRSSAGIPGLAILSGLFFLSGMSALVYETLWQRMMTLAFGASAPASSAILTSFFLGLGIGTILVPRVVRTSRNLLLLYAGIELAIAIAALAVPLLLRMCEAIYVASYPMVGDRPALYHLLRFGLSILVVLPATLAMGATLPVMSEIFKTSGLTKAHGISLAYGLNTLGSVLGCLLTGFVLMHALGLRRSYLLAASLNLLVVVAIATYAVLGRSHTGRVPEPLRKGIARASGRPRGGRDEHERSGSGEPAPRVGYAPPSPPRKGAEDIRRWLALYFVSGALAIGYEIVWLRILSIYNSSSIVTFTLTLSTVLLGFALGSLVIYRALASRWSGELLFAISHVGAGTSALLGALVAGSFPHLTKRLVLDYAQIDELSAWNIVLKECVTSILLVLPAATFLGMTFPALCQKLQAGFSDAARLSAMTYSIGTFGSALGGLLFGLFLVSSLGLVRCMAILCASSALIGLLALGGSRSGTRHSVLRLSAIVLILGSAVYLLQARPHIGLGTLQSSGGRLFEISVDGENQSRILRYKEGNNATVIIKESLKPIAGVRRVFVDDQLVASTDVNSKIDSKMLAHLPLLLHPSPRRALTVGFGSGGTSWSMTRHGIPTEVVEIEPEVVRSARLLADQNYNVLDDPLLKVILDDARNYLHVTPERFDVISTDVTNLQYKQNPYLYTEEYFRLMKNRLTPSGIACAWVPMAAIQPGEFKILLNTFAKVFPHASLWFINNNFTTFGIFIGTPGRLSIDLGRIQRAFDDEKVRGDLLEIGVNHPFQIPGFLQLDEEGVRRYVGSAQVHTDDWPILEFTSPVSFYVYYQTFFQNLEETLELRPLRRDIYVTNLDLDQRALFERYTRASNMWSYVVLNMAAGTRRDTLEKGIQLSRMALSLVPDQPAGGKILESLEVQYKQLQAGAPR